MNWASQLFEFTVLTHPRVCVQELEYCQSVVLSVTDDVGVHTVIADLLSAMSSRCSLVDVVCSSLRFSLRYMRVETYNENAQFASMFSFAHGAYRQECCSHLEKGPPFTQTTGN